jgi:hypothetical protein
MGFRRRNVVLVTTAPERPPLSDKRSYGCTRRASAASLVYNAAMKRDAARPDTDPGAPAPPACTRCTAPPTLLGRLWATDEGIVRALTASLSEEGRFALTEVTHIMVDEAQDMKPLFYRLICRLVSMARSPTLMLVGDPPTGRSIAGTLRTRAS